MSFDEYVIGYVSYHYFIGHPTEALQNCLNDTDEYFYADTFSEYVLHELFQPFDEGLVMVMVEQAKSFNNAQIYYGSLLWLSVGLLFGSDKGFGGGTTGWKFGSYKSSQKWANQMTKRGWTVEQINEAVLNGARYNAVNNINPDHPATRYVHPVTGRSVIIDDVTQEVLHIGGDGFVY